MVGLYYDPGILARPCRKALIDHPVHLRMHGGPQGDTVYFRMEHLGTHDDNSLTAHAPTGTPGRAQAANLVLCLGNFAAIANLERKIAAPQLLLPSPPSMPLPPLTRPAWDGTAAAGTCDNSQGPPALLL